MGKVVPFVGREKDMAIIEATVTEAIEESALCVREHGDGLPRDMKRVVIFGRGDERLRLAFPPVTAPTLHSVAQPIPRRGVATGDGRGGAVETALAARGPI
jgi:hypothetical protein